MLMAHTDHQEREACLSIDIQLEPAMPEAIPVFRRCRVCDALDGSKYLVEPARVRTNVCHVGEDFLCDRPQCVEVRELEKSSLEKPALEKEKSAWVLYFGIEPSRVRKRKRKPTIEDKWRGVSTYANDRPADILLGQTQRDTANYAETVGGMERPRLARRPHQELRCTYTRNVYREEREWLVEYPRAYQKVIAAEEGRIQDTSRCSPYPRLWTDLTDWWAFERHALDIRQLCRQYNARSDYHYEIYKHLFSGDGRPLKDGAVLIDLGVKPKYAAESHRLREQFENDLATGFELDDAAETDVLMTIFRAAEEEARARASQTDAGRLWVTKFDDWRRRCDLMQPGAKHPKMPLPPDEIGEWLSQLYQTYTFFMAARSSWGAYDPPPGGAVGHDLTWLRESTQERTADDNERVALLEQAITVAENLGNMPQAARLNSALEYLENKIKSGSVTDDMSANAVRKAVNDAVKIARELVENADPANWETRLANAIDQTTDSRGGLYALAKMDNSPERLYFLVDHDTTDPVHLEDAINDAALKVLLSNEAKDRRKLDMGEMYVKYGHVSSLLENAPRIVLDARTKQCRPVVFIPVAPFHERVSLEGLSVYWDSLNS